MRHQLSLWDFGLTAWLCILLTRTMGQTEFDTQLTGAKAEFNKGIVSVFYNGSWTNLCGESFGQNEAEVICRQLGYSGVTTITSQLETIREFGVPSVNTYLYGLTCSGSEASLSGCVFGTEYNTCIINAAGVLCAGPMPALTLTGSSEPQVGIVQVTQNGRPFTLCTSDWTVADAHTTCRTLGFDYAFGIPGIDDFDVDAPSDGLLVSTECTGYEDDLLDCSLSLVNFKNYSLCGAGNSVATVNCTSQPRTRLGDTVRLVEGEFPGEGLAEVSFHGQWWRLTCSYQVAEEVATVICHQLGYRHLLMRDDRLSRRKGITPIYDDITCLGNETSLADCDYEVREFSCYFGDYDITIICTNETLVPLGSDVRLVQGTTEYEGRVEVAVGNRYGAVCSSSTWDLKAGNVLCRQLGFEPAVAAPRLAYFGSDMRTSYMSNVVCYGNESALSDCSFTGPEGVRCSSGETASVICGNDYRAPEDYQVRLVGSPEKYEGRVEVGYDGQWGGICRTGFTHEDAAVVCRMLGKWGGIEWAGDYGSSEGPVVMSGVACTERESHIADCLHQGPPGSCPSGELAGVYCSGSVQNYQDFNARIAGGESSSFGRPEVFYNGSWGYLCLSSLGSHSGEAFCEKLGHDPANTNLTAGGPATLLSASPLVFNCSQSVRGKLSECKFVLNEKLPLEGCDKQGIALLDCEAVVPKEEKPKKNVRFIVQMVFIGLTVLLALVSITSLIVRCCLSGSDSPDQSNSANYNAVAQSDGGTEGTKQSSTAI
ncbi:scavenger receptor cysteine-rich domain superfamily protein-like [Diadema antillarum]|uniref:scavenger receptor cysteine-rich domain superfamily protein-like n=1 Tax=Diadema antillarum TaxID=105358 RepID=UPI003A856ECD